MLRRALPVTLAVSIAGAIAFATMASAQDYARTGFYVSAGGSYATPTDIQKSLRNALQIETIPAITGFASFPSGNQGFPIEPPVPKRAAQVSGSFGVDVRAGFRLSEWAAIETRAHWLHGFRSDFESFLDARDPADPTDDAIVEAFDNFRIESTTWTVDLKTYLSRGRVQPYMIGGFGAMWTTIHGGARDRLGKRTGIDVNAPEPNPGLAGTFSATRCPDPVEVGNPFSVGFCPAPLNPNGSDPRFPQNLQRNINAANDPFSFTNVDGNRQTLFNGNQTRAAFQLGQFQRAFEAERRKFEINKLGVVVRAGAGVDVYVTEHIVVFGEVSYLGAFGDVADLDQLVVSQGVTYRF